MGHRKKILSTFSLHVLEYSLVQGPKSSPRAESAPSVAFFFLFMIQETRFNQQLPTAGSVKWFLKHPKWAIFQKKPIKNGKNQAPPTFLSYRKRC